MTTEAGNGGAAVFRPYFEIVRLKAPEVPGVSLKWSLDFPKSAVAFEPLQTTRFRLQGWTLDDNGAEVHVALRTAGLTRCYPLNRERPDVIRHVLAAEPDGHPSLMCGFDLAFPVAPEIEFGFEIDARFVWLLQLRLVEARSA